MTKTKVGEEFYDADTPTKRQAFIKDKIRDIEDMVEEAFPNNLYDQNYLFTRLYNNIQARVLHANHYQDRLKRPEKRVKKNPAKELQTS